jgi:hypothetical protein
VLAYRHDVLAEEPAELHAEGRCVAATLHSEGRVCFAA